MALVWEHHGLKSLGHDNITGAEAVALRPDGTLDIVRTAPPKARLPGIDAIYVINLDARKDRWDSLMAAEPGLEAMADRVSAVNGRALGMTAEIYHLFTNNIFKWKKSVIGCSLSHIDVWRRVAALPAGSVVLVLEDDVRFRPGWRDRLADGLAAVPADADLLYLGGVLPLNLDLLKKLNNPVNPFWSNILTNTSFYDVPSELFHFCAYSYILTQRGANKLMSFVSNTDVRVNLACDLLIGHPMIGLVKYFASPLLTYCYQDLDDNFANLVYDDPLRIDKFDSDICNNNEYFSEAELAPFRHADDPLCMYHAVHGDISPPRWLSDIRLLKFVFLQNVLLYHNTWFIMYEPNAMLLDVFNRMVEAGAPFNVLHLGDELGQDDVSFYPLCNKVVRNSFRGGLGANVHTIPYGYRCRHRIDPRAAREHVWSFHGGPVSCEYMARLANSQFCSVGAEGPLLYEALEVRTLPVTATKNGPWLAWVESEMGLSELYDWTSPAEAIRAGATDVLRAEVGRRWAAWKARVRDLIAG